MSEPLVDALSNPALVEFGARVEAAWDQLSPAERAAAVFLRTSDVGALLHSSAAALGTRAGTSSATIVRTIQAVGYDGLSDLKSRVATAYARDVAPEVRYAHQLEAVKGDAPSVRDAVVREATEVLESIAAQTEFEDVAAAAALLDHAETIHCYGAGLSMVAAEIMVKRLGRLGLRARRIIDEGFEMPDALLQLRAGDAVVLFVPARFTPGVEIAVQHAKARGAAVLLLTAASSEDIPFDADLTINAPLPTGSLISESLASIVIVDALTQMLLTLDANRALKSRYDLTRLRGELGFTT